RRFRRRGRCVHRRPAADRRARGEQGQIIVATNERMLRRGLPRTPGGEPWPPAGVAPAAEAPAAAVAPETPQPSVTVPAATTEATSAAAAPAAEAAAAPVVATTAAVGTRAVRRGLPRTPGGEPWPPAGTVAASAANKRAASAPAEAAPPAAEAPAATQAPSAPAAA